MESINGYYSNGKIQILGNPPISEGMPVVITFIEDSSSIKMNEELFWNLIDSLDWSSNNQEIVAPLISKLSKMNEEDIFMFQEILSEKLFLLDTKIHAENIGEDSYKEGKYFSPNIFLYVRACVVANGKECYLEVLNHPENMPKDVDFEPLLYVASEAYYLKTNKNDFSPNTKYSPETFSNKEGWCISKSIIETAMK